jgi:hypothetical protein
MNTSERIHFANKLISVLLSPVPQITLLDIHIKMFTNKRIKELEKQLKSGD